MEEHISYAMRNEEAVASLVYLNAPGDLLDWSFLAMEGIIAIGAVLAIVHALRHRARHGHPSALLTLAGAFAYGLLMDIASYYTVENFWHGEFSVMLLHNRLPLYIALLYPVLLYHLYMTIRRFELGALVEALSVGFYGGLMYAIFDNLGPLLGWWIWDRSDPTTWPYLNSVPLTSYHWFFLFTATFALMTRLVCWRAVAKGLGGLRLVLGVLAIPIGTVAIGVALFVPYNAFAYNGMLEIAALLHAVVFAAAGGLFFFRHRPPAAPRDARLMAFPLVYLAGLLYLYIAKDALAFGVGPDGLSADGRAMGNLPAVIACFAGSTAILLRAHPTPGRES